MVHLNYSLCTVTYQATTCPVISLKSLDSCRTSIACESSFMVALFWISTAYHVRIFITSGMFHRILNNNNLVGEIPAQLANCFSLITLYVFCATLCSSSMVINFYNIKAWVIFISGTCHTTTFLDMSHRQRTSQNSQWIGMNNGSISNLWYPLFGYTFW